MSENSSDQGILFIFDSPSGILSAANVFLQCILSLGIDDWETYIEEES